jgi:uncharacterized protein
MIGPLAMLGGAPARRATPRFLPRALLLAALALAAAPLAAQQPVPRLTGRVVDTTATLSSVELAALEQKLAALEKRKGSQIAVLIVKSTQPEAIEQYSLRVAEAWQIGRGKTDDGIVVVVAKDDRKLRIEVGYGLEGAVPDALAKRIIAERITPRFAAGDFAGGLNDGVDALIALIDGEALPPPAAAARGERNRGNDGDGGSFGLFPFVLFFALFLAPILRRVFGSLFGALAVGVGAGFVAWLFSSMLFLAFAVGGVAFVLALAGVAGGPGRWSSGGGYWGGRGGFGGGGGGFSGGGGRFGGGGASGGW